MPFGNPEDEVLNQKPALFGSSEDSIVSGQPSEEPIGPLTAGWKNMMADIETGGAGLAAAFPETSSYLGINPEDLLTEAEQKRREVSRRYKPKVPSFTDIRGPGDVLQYAYEQGAQSLPYMGATALGALAGAATGGAAISPVVAGIIGGTLASTPAFVGQNIQEQIDQGRSLKDTSLAAATGAGLAQGALDTLIGEVLPGVGRAVSGGLVLRAIKKGLEGGAIESLTNAAQQAIQVGQADPSKLFELGPEVQHELAEAAVAGGIVGAGIGSVAGGFHKKKGKVPAEPVQSTPQAEEAIPPASNYTPGIIEEAPVEFNRMEPSEVANGTGFPIPNVRQPFQEDTGVMFPEVGTGSRVFDEVRNKLISAGQNPVAANSMARLAQARYETLGKQTGTDAYTAFQNSNIDITGPGAGASSGQSRVFNQEPLEQNNRAEHYSQLVSALNRAKMKEGTGQQWRNALIREGVKPEEMEWTGLGDVLKDNANKKMTRDQVQFGSNWQPYKVDVYAANPHEQFGKNAIYNSYADWTLGAHGANPESNYREVVLSDASQPTGTYRTDHWRQVPNPIAHYRTTDHVTPGGQTVQLVNEIQSDWHQTGRERGYRGTQEDLNKAFDEWSSAGRKLQEGIINEDDYLRVVNELKRQQMGVPSAPFKETWPNLAFRQALMDAINRGKDYLAWPTAEQQMDIQGHTDPRRLKGHQDFYDTRLVNYANKLGEPFGAKVQDVKLSEGHTVHALPITDHMRELVGTGGLPLFQRKVGERTPVPQGNISILPDKMVIRLFKSANESTPLHEFGHAWLEELVRHAPVNREIAFDLQTVRDWVGNDGGAFTRAQHEKFARGLELYAREGKAPTKALADVFKKFMAWLQSIYKRAEELKANGEPITLTPKMRRVYDNLFNQHEGAQGYTTSKGPGGLKYKAPIETRKYNVRTEGAPAPSPGQVYSQLPPEAEEKVSRWDNLKRATNAFFDPFSEIPSENKYRDIRNLLGGGVYAAEKSAKEAKDLFKGLSQAEKNSVNEYFDTANAPSSMVPEKIRDKTTALKRYINGPLRDQLIERGLLPDSIKDNDAYLPRLYLKYLMEGEGYKGGIRLAKTYANKKREKTPEQLIAMGEVKDPAVRAFHALYRTQRDVAVKGFLDKVANNPEWVLPESLVPWNGKKVTPFWLKQEASEIRTKRVKGEPDPARKEAMLQQATRMEEAAQQGLDALDQKDFDSKEFKPIPDSPDYGPLRGMIVRRQIADDIIGTNNFVNPDNTWDKLFGDRSSALTKGVGIWKALKVPLNPPSQMRNIMSNMILLNLSGIRIDKVVPRMIEAANDMRKHGPYTQIAEKYGVGRGTFSENELYVLSDELNRLDLESAAGFAGWRKVYRTITRIGQGMTDIYGKMEEWGKIAKIIDEMKNGKPENDAVRAANEALFDYSEVHPFIRRARQSPIGLPFLCVDTQTEILTQRGWLTSDQVQIGDMAASFSMANECLVWDEIVELFRAPYNGDMVSVKDRHLDMMLTPNHRVVSYRRRRIPGKRAINGKYRSLEIVSADRLTVSDHIPVAAPFNHSPVGTPIADAMAEFLGWYISEGHMHRKCSAVWISQNEGDKANKIRNMLSRNNFGYTEVYCKRAKNKHTEVRFYIKAKHGKLVREICPDKKLTADLVMRMTKDQLDLFIEAFIEGDGCRSGSSKPVIIQKDKVTLDGLQMALSILGKSYGLYLRKSGTSSISLRHGTSYCVKRGLKGVVHYSGDIWCPRTKETGTWLARRNGKVFITGNTFQTKVIPLLYKTIKERPSVLLPYIALGYTIPALVAASNEIDQDDTERLRKSLSSGLRRQNSMYLLPWKDANNHWQFIDIGYFMPWQMPFDIVKYGYKAAGNIAEGDRQEAFQNLGQAFQATTLFSNPIFNIAGALTTGIDPFTGQPIADKRDPAQKQIVDVMSYLESLAMPSLLTSYGALGKIWSKEQGTGLNRYGEPSYTYGQIGARAMGVNTYPVVPEAQRARNIRQMMFDIQDVKGRMSSSLRDQSLTPEQRQDIAKEFRGEILDRTKALQKYIKESAPSERLLKASQP